ncbi:MAG TPA: DUF2934 domain-containing protein [Candidatus Didemnitutus sp.]|nr:DUF2934 domain-containing protein [Candidatus Didemnitutus sp.]
MNSPTPRPSGTVEPIESDIQHQAYFLWKEAGSPAGQDLDFWLRAREELRHHAGLRPRRPKRPQSR